MAAEWMVELGGDVMGIWVVLGLEGGVEWSFL